MHYLEKLSIFVALSISSTAKFMRKILLLTTLFFNVLMMAGPVDQETAKRKALDFAAAKMGTKVQRALKATDCGVHKASKRASVTRDYLHVFNNGSVEWESMPENMRAFLQEYADGIQALDDNQVTSATPNKVMHGNQSMRAPSRAAKTSVSPLMTTLWNQGSPYDQNCPEYNGNKAATGCVATALAQVMGYHRWPNATTTMIPAFTTDTRGFSLSAIPAGTAIDWSNIKNYYGYYKLDGSWKNEPYTDAQAEAVAKLMQLCGYSVQMDYYCDNSGQSGAITSDCIPALIKYFDYEESTCRWINRANYSYTDWQDMIYTELKAKRPVLYSGQSEGGGHAFVCDGYDSDDFFHINWGWAGVSNGFFRLRLLNPDDQGIGGSSTSEGYGMGQGAGIGIKPNDGTSTPYVDKVTAYAFNCSESSFTRTSSTANFTLSGISYSIWNYTGTTQTFDAGLRILDSKGNKVEDLGPTVTNKTLDHTWYNSWSNIPAFGAGYANGTYKMVLIARPAGSTNWYVCENAEGKCLDFIISGNTLTIASPVLEFSHTEEGELTANSDITIKLNVKNTGTKGFRSDLHYKINSGDWKAAGFVDAEPGETDVVEIKFQPTSSGSYAFTFGEIDYSFDLTIDAGSIAVLTGTYNSATPAISYDSSQDVYYVDGTSTTANFTVTNTGGGTYNNNIVFNFFYYSASQSKWIYYKEDVQTISLAAGESKNLTTVINKVDNSDYLLYCVQMNWISNGDKTYLANTPFFEFRGSSDAFKLEATYTANPSIVSGDLDGDGVTDYYVNDDHTNVTFTVTNTGGASFSGMLAVDYVIHNVNDGKLYYMSADTEKTLELAPGESTTIGGPISFYNNSNYDYYAVRLWYYDNDYHLINRTPNFVFNCAKLEWTGNYSSSLELKKDGSTYYVEGDQVDVSFEIQNNGAMAYNGKIAIQLEGKQTSDNQWVNLKAVETRNLNLAVGEKTNVSFTINKSAGNEYSLYYGGIREVTYNGYLGANIVGTPDFEFRTPTIQPGDANGDGQVNVTDIVAIVNYIMDNPPAGFNFTAADVNNDGAVNVTDIVQIVNIIMSSGARMDSEEVYKILKANGFIFKGE